MNQVLKEFVFPNGKRLQLVKGDITEERVDAIVNAANEHLAHGGGLAAAIARKGGPQIQAESDDWVRKHGEVTAGSPAVTSGGRLPCKYVIHAVGPRWGEGDEDEKLRRAVQGALQKAAELNLASIAVPAISTGIFGFPVPRAAVVILKAIRDSLEAGPSSSLELVRLTIIDQPTLDPFLSRWPAVIQE